MLSLPKFLYMCARSLSRVQLSAVPWTVASQAPLSMEFSRQEYCSELPLCAPGNLLEPEIEPTSLASPALTDSLSEGLSSIPGWRTKILQAYSQTIKKKKKKMQQNKYVSSVFRNFSHPSVSTEIKIYHVRDVRDVNCSFIWGLMRASPVAQLVKNPPAIRETWVQSLDWEDPLEKGKATHSSVLAWRIPRTIQCMGSQRVGHNSATLTEDDSLEASSEIVMGNCSREVKGVPISIYVILEKEYIQSNTRLIESCC